MMILLIKKIKPTNFLNHKLRKPTIFLNNFCGYKIFGVKIFFKIIFYGYKIFGVKIYGYKIFDGEGNELDSCYGFYGDQTCEDAGKEMVDYYDRTTPKQYELEFSVDSNGYYMGDNLTPEQEEHNLALDTQ